MDKKEFEREMKAYNKKLLKDIKKDKEQKIYYVENRMYIGGYFKTTKYIEYLEMKEHVEALKKERKERNDKTDKEERAEIRRNIDRIYEENIRNGCKFMTHAMSV